MIGLINTNYHYDNMAPRKKEPPAVKVIVLSCPRKAFSGRSLKDRLEADLAFELEGQRVVKEAERLHKASGSLLRSAEALLRHLKDLERVNKKSA
jgi:hypothetical protein